MLLSRIRELQGRQEKGKLSDKLQKELDRLYATAAELASFKLKIGDRAKVIPNKYTFPELVGVEVTVLSIDTEHKLDAGYPITVRYESDFEGIEGIVPSSVLEVL